MNRLKMTALLLAFAATMGCSTIREHMGDPRDIDRSGLGEPSGVAYHPTRKTLFVVDDSGELLEMKTNGETVNRRHLEDADCEGVTVDPSTGRVYVGVEGQERIWEIDPDSFRILREFAIPRQFEGKTVLKAGGQGIESIEFVPDANHPQGGTFFVTNQAFDHSDPEDDSVLVEVEVPLRLMTAKYVDARILRVIPMEMIDLSGMHYDAKRNLLIIISDARNLLMEVDRDGKVLSTRPLPGVNQEGIAFDDEGNMYIAQDSGGVLKIKP